MFLRLMSSVCPAAESARMSGPSSQGDRWTLWFALRDRVASMVLRSRAICWRLSDRGRYQRCALVDGNLLSSGREGCCRQWLDIRSSSNSGQLIINHHVWVWRSSPEVYHSSQRRRPSKVSVHQTLTDSVRTPACRLWLGVSRYEPHS